MAERERSHGVVLEKMYRFQLWLIPSVEKFPRGQRIQSWIAHAEHADTRRLRRTLFRGGWFDPAAEGLPVLGRAAGRLVEQRITERARGKPQQERAREPEQQQRVSSRQNAPVMQ